MPINIFNLLALAATNTNATSYATGTPAPTAGRIQVLISNAIRAAGEPNTPTVSGWTQIGSSQYQAPGKLSAFWRLSAPSSAATIDFGGQTQDAHAYAMFEFSGLNTTTPFLQPKGGGVAAGTTFTITFDNAFGKSSNGVLAVCGTDLNAATLRPEQGYNTPVLASNYFFPANASDGVAITYAFRPDNDAACAFTHGTGNGTGLLIELNSADAGSGVLLFKGDDKLYTRKYNTLLAGAYIIRRQHMKADGTGFATNSDWTPGAGDVVRSIDGAAFANVTNLPAYTNGAWEYILTAAELSSRQTNVKIIDATIQSDEFTVETYGNASAMYGSDLSVAADTAVRDAIFARAFSAAYGSLTFDEIMKILIAANAGETTGAGTGTIGFRNLIDTANVIVATMSGGNRTGIVLTP